MCHFNDRMQCFNDRMQCFPNIFVRGALLALLVYVIVVYVFLDAATLTEVFPCFFLSFKANARANLAKTGHGAHSPKLLCCSMYCLFCVVLCIVCV